jgi:thioredoxin reductase (NADPH)
MMPRVAVIGAGPAGIAAAIQLTRAGHDVAVFERDRAGGNLWNAGFVENYPGFPGGIAGKNLARLMDEQFQDLGLAPRNADVREVRKSGTGFTVVTDKEEEFDGAIICTGTVPRKAGFPGEQELVSAGLLHYGISRLKNLAGSGDALVIGGGESSMDMALSLAEMGQKVVLLHRSEPRGIKRLLDEVAGEDSVTLLQGAVLGARIHGEKAVMHLETSTGKEERPFDLVLVAVGRERKLPALEGIDADNPPPGLRMAGDARHGGLGQAAMAVGDGVKAAMELGRELGK